MKKMELKFNMEDWIKILVRINLEQTDPETNRLGGFSPSYKKEVIARNEECKIISQFLSDLRKKKADNKKEIDAAYKQPNMHPFPELLELPQTKNGLIARTIKSYLEKLEQKDLYYHLLENNKIPNYQELVWRMSDENRRDNIVLKYDMSKNEDSLLRIFQSAIALCPPSEIQIAFEYFAKEYEELENIDSKKETEEKRDEILSNFHKAMRQTDMFGNGHASSIIYNLWYVSDIVIRAMIAVTEHMKELKKEKV
jgi:hypothetical protein